MLPFLNYWISDLPKKSASFCIKNIPEFALGKFLPAAVMSHAYQLQATSSNSKIVTRFKNCACNSFNPIFSRKSSPIVQEKSHLKLINKSIQCNKEIVTSKRFAFFKYPKLPQNRLNEIQEKVCKISFVVNLHISAG